MQPINNYANIQASSGGFEKPGPGAYLCRITNVFDVPMDPKTGKGDYLRVEFDIHEGKFKDYYSEGYQRIGKWFGSFIRSYKEKALPMFKHFTETVERSNVGYKWDWNERGLCGKLIGLVFGEEEYVAGTGEVKTRTYVADVKTADQIDSGDYKVPALKLLSGGQVPVQVAAPFPVSSDDDSDLPWN